MNPLKKLASQTFVYGFSSVIGRLLNYLLVPLYTRYFLPSEYGVVTELYAYVAFLVVVLTYGFETAFFRFSNNEDKKTVYATALISLIISSVIFVVITLYYAPSISTYIGFGIETRFIKWFAIILGLDAVSSISFALLREQGKALRFAFIRIVNILTNISLNIYFIVYRGFGIEYIFISNLFASIVTVLLLMPEMITSSWVFDKKVWKKMIIYALPLLIAGLAGVTNETIDRVLLKQLLPNKQIAASELGLYGAFYKLSIIMTLFIQTFRFAAEPFFFAHKKEGKSKGVYADIMKYFIIIMAIIFLSVTIFYDTIKMFLGKEYHDERGFLVVSILLLANLFLGIYYNLSIWYKLTDKTKFGAYLSIFGAFITILFNVILVKGAHLKMLIFEINIPALGFIGSAWATLLCYFSMTIASYRLGKKHFPIPYELRRIMLYLTIMIAIYLFIYFTGSNMFFNILYLAAFILLILYSEGRSKKGIIRNN